MAETTEGADSKKAKSGVQCRERERKGEREKRERGRERRKLS